jgi:hypothetical protein
MPNDQKILKHIELEAKKPDEISQEELEKVSGGFAVTNTCEIHQKTAGDQDD